MPVFLAVYLDVFDEIDDLSSIGTHYETLINLD